MTRAIRIARPKDSAERPDQGRHSETSANAGLKVDVINSQANLPATYLTVTAGPGPSLASVEAECGCLHRGRHSVGAFAKQDCLESSPNDVQIKPDRPVG